ncbi:MAG: LysR substrate-binding domain-containing protein [Myxococcales bacterium]|nr:LysR substrate-binding domain-containing protein [Myxococcales bacterium]
MMDLLLLRSFLRVADLGAITEAAHSLGLSQPALSRRIQQLEQALGAELLLRSQRGVVLTDSGRIVAREGRAVVERYERLRESIAAAQRLEAGVVRLGGGATAVAYLLPQAIAAFQRQHPSIRFELKEAGSREIVADVREERLELGIVTLPVADSELTIEPLRDDRIVLVAATDHPLARRGGRRTVGVEALREQSLVGFEAGSAIRQHIDAALREAGVEMRVVMELRSIAAILQMVASTGSLAFVSELGVAQADARVATVGVRGLKIVRQLALITKRERPLSAASQAFAGRLVRGG